MNLGTYQNYITSPAKYTTRIPDEVDDFVAAPLMCSGATMYRSVSVSGNFRLNRLLILYSQIRASGLPPGQWAVFSGAGGGVGSIGIQIARAMGLRVISVDGGDEKAKLCMDLGSEVFVDFTKVESVEQEVLGITGGKGAHGIFITATHPSAYATAPSMLRVGGIVMCIGLRKLPLVELKIHSGKLKLRANSFLLKHHLAQLLSVQILLFLLGKPSVLRVRKLGR